MTQELTLSSTTTKAQCLFAKIGEGRWYAIPQAMEDSFRKAGALVSDTADNEKDEQSVCAV